MNGEIEKTKIVTGENTSLKFEVVPYDEEEQASTSLTDRYGIAVFTDEFSEKEQQYKENHQAELDLILNQVMENEKNSITEVSFENVMDANVESVIKADYESSNEMEILSAISYGILGMFLAGVVCFLISRRKKKDEDYLYD